MRSEQLCLIQRGRPRLAITQPRTPSQKPTRMRGLDGRSSNALPGPC